MFPIKKARENSTHPSKLTQTHILTRVGSDKKFFSQNFLFKDNSCVTVSGDGSYQTYFYPSGSDQCKSYKQSVDDFGKKWCGWASLGAVKVGGANATAGNATR